MQLGLIGLGKMGGSMAERIRRAGHEVIGYDHHADKRDVDSLPALVEALSAPRVVWVMVPSGEPTRATVKELAGLLSPGDVIVDGGNSKYTDDQVHDVMCREKNIGYVDAGVSGGVWGLENGYALMVGGSKDDVAKVQPIFDALPAAVRPTSRARRCPERLRARRAGGRRALQQDGPQRHRVRDDAGLRRGLRAAGRRRPDRGRPGVIASWTQGTVIRSWLLDLLVRALHEDPELERITGYAEDSGEGRWTVEQAIENAVPCRRSPRRCSPGSSPGRTTRRP